MDVYEKCFIDRNIELYLDIYLVNFMYWEEYNIKMKKLLRICFLLIFLIILKDIEYSVSI